MGAASASPRTSKGRGSQIAPPHVAVSFTLGQELVIFGDVPTDTYIVSGVEVRRDDMVVLRVVRKDAPDG